MKKSLKITIGSMLHYLKHKNTLPRQFIHKEWNEIKHNYT